MRLLSAFQEIRQSRWEQIAQVELHNVRMLTFTEGTEEWKERTEHFSAIQERGGLDWDDVDDEEVLKNWEELSFAFGYDANDAADDWWVDWGIMERRLKRSDTVSDKGEEESEQDTSFKEALADYGMTRVVVSSSVTV